MLPVGHTGGGNYSFSQIIIIVDVLITKERLRMQKEMKVDRSEVGLYRGAKKS